jgi:hypothetical protein
MAKHSQSRAHHPALATAIINRDAGTDVVLEDALSELLGRAGASPPSAQLLAAAAPLAVQRMGVATSWRRPNRHAPGRLPPPRRCNAGWPVPVPVVPYMQEDRHTGPSPWRRGTPSQPLLAITANLRRRRQ